MKKRILSLILALSMVLSVLPLGAFAADPNQDLVMQGGFPVGTSGNGWSYDDYTKKLTLTRNSGTYNFSSTHPQNPSAGTQPAPAVLCAIVISSGATITGGTFAGSVTNWSTISGGTFQNTCSVINHGTIKDNGIFEGKVTNYTSGTILDGTFRGKVDNSGIVENGTFEGSVQNYNNRISGGTFQNGCSVTNWSTISGGTFQNTCSVENNDGGKISDGTFKGGVKNNAGGTISNGTFACGVENKGKINGDGTFEGTVENNGIISDGTFKGGVINYKTISGGTFQNTYSVENHGTIEKGTFEGIVANNKTISGGTFQSTSNVTNDGTINGNGIFAGIVTNNRFISGGTFQSTSNVINANDGTISDGTFAGRVINNSTISGGAFQNTCSVTNYGTIKGNGTFNGEVSNNAATATIENGTFNGKVSNNQGGKITNGTFKQEVINNAGGEISGGTFKETVLNGNGIITGGTFAAGLSRNDGSVTGGIFNGDTGLTDAHHVTVTNGSVLKVNDEAPLKVDETTGAVTTGTAWDLYSYKDTTMTITASTDIYSLNDQPIVDGNCKSSYDGSNKTIVKFTMPNRNVELGTGGLVMAGGYPVGTSGNGWSYDNNTQTLTLKSGTYDFSSTEPVQCAIESDATIIGGTFNGEVTNHGNIKDGTFEGTVKNYSGGTISGGTFNGTVENYGGTISSGTFKGTVQHWYGTISGGTFHEKVLNSHGEITGGTFAAGLSANNGAVTGGVFNGNTGLNGVTDLHSIKWDDAYPNAKIEKVNGVSANWAPYVVVTEWTTATAKEVTITADTEIFSLNGRLLGEGDRVNGNKNTVKFTMPDDKDVVLSTGELVMAGGYPVGTSGKGWSYDSSTQTLTLTYGTFDFSFTYPQNAKGAGAEPVKCAIESYATISGGIFDKAVTNDTEGMISGNGTFKGEVKNHNGTISGGKFEGTVINDVNGTISDGTFNKEVSNINGNISNGTFNETVTNDAGGTIYGGTFAGGVNNKNDRIYGGVFNGNATLTNVTGLHSITVASGAKIKEVNDVSADWAPYVVTSNATTKEVTITADTEIFSLNGKPIAESSYGVDKKTVTFTMPDEDVVLNKAITSTDLVMEKGYPKDSDGGKTPCKGDGWEYIPNDPTNGDMLLLTGSNQTGGLYDFSTIGDGSAVKCNVFVGKPTAITGGEFNGKVFNNSGILGGTFHGEVENMGPGTIKDGTFKNSVENNGMIENGAFHDEVKNNGTINDGTFHGKVENNSVINSGTFNGPVDNTTMSRIENGTFNDAVENNGTIEKGTFHGAVKNSGTINDGTFHGAVENNGIINSGTFNGAVTDNGTISGNITGSGTLNGEPIEPTPEPKPEPKPEPEPEPEPKPEPTPEPEPKPEPTTYTVTVIGGTIDGKTSVSAKENDTLTVVLDQNDIPDGMTFDLWSISSSKLSGDINVDYRAEAMTFKMPAEDVTIRAQYRSAEIIEDAAPSPLATAATIAVGGAAAGIVVWQGVNLGVDLYLANALPQGVPVPTDRRALALLLWETAGKPEVALPTLYGDIPAEEIELQKATRWAVQNGLMDAADKKDASFFDPDHYVTKMDVFGAWLRLKKLLGTIGTSPTQ